MYPMLGRLNDAGLVNTNWKQEGSHRPRKYYSLTSAGVAALEAFPNDWARFRDTVDKVLSVSGERLGSPELIAAEAGAEAVVGRPSRIKEVIGLIMISVGSLIPIVGWVVGIVLVWMSPVWSKAQKLLATLVWPFGWFTMLLFGLMSTRSSSSFDQAASNGALQALGVILLVAAPVVVLRGSSDR